MDDWVLACINIEVAGVRSLRCRGRYRKTWKECVKDDMKVLGLQPEYGRSVLKIEEYGENIVL